MTRAAVDAAVQDVVDHGPDLLFGVACVVRGAEPGGDGGVFAAAGGEHAGDAGDGRGDGDVVEVGFGDAGGGRNQPRWAGRACPGSPAAGPRYRSRCSSSTVRLVSLKMLRSVPGRMSRPA